MKQLNFKRAAMMAALVIWTFLMMGVSVNAQTVTVVATGLKRPTKVIFSEQGNVLIAEAGTGIRDGRISVFNPQTSIRRTLLDGLPSAVGRFNLPQGPSGLVMHGQTLYITIGEGNPTVACDAPCVQVPNPNGADSPIFSSILALDFSAQTEMTTNGFALVPGDDLALKNGHELTLQSGGDEMTIRMIADFPDVAHDPRDGAPQNVAASNPFGIELFSNHLYIADGGMNKVWQVSLNHGDIETLVTFPTIILPAGRVEAVPTSVRVHNNQLLVTLHRAGAENPLGAGLAEVRLVDPQTGSDVPFITGLTSAIDVLPVQTVGNPDYFYVLQFGVFIPGMMPVPARLLRFDAPATPPVSSFVLGGAVVNMTRDPLTGDLYMTRTFGGTIIRVRFP